MYRKFITIFFTTVFLLSSCYYSATHAEGEQPISPTANDPCKLKYITNTKEEQLTKTIIVCKTSGDDELTFRYLKPLEDTNNRLKKRYSINRDDAQYDLWNLPKTLDVYKRPAFLLTAKVGGNLSIADIVGLVGKNEQQTIATQVSDIKTSTGKIDKITGYTIEPTNYITDLVEKTDYICLTTIVDSSPSSKGLSSKNTNERFVTSLDLMVNKVRNNNLLKVSITSNKPSDTTTTRCIKHHIKPLVGDDQGKSQKAKEIKEKMITDLNATSVADSDKNTITKMVDEIYNNPGDYITKEKDIEIYKKYYSSDSNKGYPDVVVDERLIKAFQQDTQKVLDLDFFVSSKVPFREYFSREGFKSISSKIITGSAITTVAAGAASVVLIAPSAAVIGSAALVVAVLVGASKAVDSAITWSEDNQFKRLVKLQLELSLAYQYLQANVNYRKCALKQGDTSFSPLNASELDFALASATSLLDSTTDTAANLAGDPNQICDSAITEGNSFMMTIKKAICALFEWLKKEVADKIFNRSRAWLEASLGVKDPGSSYELPPELMDRPTK